MKAHSFYESGILHEPRQLFFYYLYWFDY